MKDMDKTKEELLAEIVELRRRVETLEKAEAERSKIVAEALRESEAKYRQLFEYAPAAIYEIDLASGKFISLNAVACEYSGYTKEEFLELKVWDVLTEQSLNKQLERYEKIMKGESVPNIFETEIIAKDGRKICGLVNSRFGYENGKPVRVTTVFHDITEKKRLEQELLKAQKLESLGVLAGGIAHDFNNFLSGIMGNISLAKLEAEQGEPPGDALDAQALPEKVVEAVTRNLEGSFEIDRAVAAPAPAPEGMPVEGHPTAAAHRPLRRDRFVADSGQREKGFDGRSRWVHTLNRAILERMTLIL